MSSNAFTDDESHVEKTFVTATAIIAAGSVKAQGTLLFSNAPLDGKPTIYGLDCVGGRSGNGTFVIDLIISGVRASTPSQGWTLNPRSFLEVPRTPGCSRETRFNSRSISDAARVGE